MGRGSFLKILAVIRALKAATITQSLCLHLKLARLLPPTRFLHAASPAPFDLPLEPITWVRAIIKGREFYYSFFKIKVGTLNRFISAKSTCNLGQTCEWQPWKSHPSFLVLLERSQSVKKCQNLPCQQAKKLHLRLLTGLRVQFELLLSVASKYRPLFQANRVNATLCPSSSPINVFPRGRNDVVVLGVIFDELQHTVSPTRLICPSPKIVDFAEKFVIYLFFNNKSLPLKQNQLYTRANCLLKCLLGQVSIATRIERKVMT